jgi:hypothetical protein
MIINIITISPGMSSLQDKGKKRQINSFKMVVFGEMTSRFSNITVLCTYKSSAALPL